ncbi:MAG: TraR/DksA family transcriptional regulator [Coraliomargarita sp.]
MAKKKTTAKKAAKKATKKAAKKAPAKKTTAKKSVAATKKAPTKKKTGLKKASVARAADAEKSAGDKKATPIVFSLDDVEALVASRKDEEQAKPKKKLTKTAAKKAAPKTRVIEVEDDQPAEKRVLGAASLADILGFNPAQKKKEAATEGDSIPKKWKKYYNLLLELRQHVSDELDLHTADTLKHESGAEAERIEADGGTDSFDRDFALSLVSNEQEALNEVEEAIQRMKDGTYGVCEVTGEPIDKERLTAVPFARFSLEGQKEYEQNNRRVKDRTASGGLFGDATDAPKLATDEDE